MNFKEYIEAKSNDELVELCYLIYAEQVDKLADLFPPMPVDELKHALYFEIDNLPVIVLNKILANRELIFNRELYNPSVNSEIIFNNIIRLSAKYRPDLPISAIVEGINASWISSGTKMKFAIYLSNKTEIPEDILENLVRKNSFLLPALFNRLKLSNPFRALYYLNINIDKADKLMLRPMIRTLLLNLLSLEPFNQNNYETFITYFSNTNTACRNLINEVLDTTQLKGIKQKINVLSNPKIPINPVVEFSPNDFAEAQRYVTSYIYENNASLSDLVRFNLDVMVFSILFLLKNNQINNEINGSRLIIEFDKIYKEKFHLYLKKYGATYNPIEDEIAFDGQLYPLAFDLDIFLASTRELKDRAANNRISSLKSIV